MANGYKLDKGFLFDSGWEKQFRRLKPKDFHALFWELYDYQQTRGESVVPDHDENLLMSSIVTFVVPQLTSRINGSKRSVNGKGVGEGGTLPPCEKNALPPTPLKIREDKIEDKINISFIQSIAREEEAPYAVFEDREEAKRKYLGGKLGKGVVLLSPEQFDDLLDKLSLEEFDKYVEIVAVEELKGHHYTKKTHYEAILDMAEKDRRKR